jgi:hypothetical protein
LAGLAKQPEETVREVLPREVFPDWFRGKVLEVVSMDLACGSSLLSLAF